MKNGMRKLIYLVMLVCMILPSAASAKALNSAPAAPADDIATITVMHTNDFHGNLELSGSNPGMARTANVIKTNWVANNTLLLDAGDIMQGSLLSNLKKGEPTIDVYNYVGYNAATFGNHEFDWSQAILQDRVNQATFPFVSSNITVKDGADCASSGWAQPAFVDAPWITITVGSPITAVIGILAVTTQETPYITLAGNTAGVCFKDPAESILHYFDAVDAQADAIIVLSHLGAKDGGYGYGISVYGDRTLADKLNTAGKKPNLIIGGHEHLDMTAAEVRNGITIVQAHYAGRKVGKAVLTINKTAGTVGVAWTRLVVSTSGAQDAGTKARIELWSLDPAYLALINTKIGYTNVGLVRNYDGDSLMGEFINDAIYKQMNGDAEPLNDADMVFNNAGGLRADVTSTTYPYTLTYGTMFSILPFGNQTIVGDMTGAQILELLNQSATLEKGAIQPAGVQFKFYRYSDSIAGTVNPFAWGAYDVKVKNRTTGFWEPLDLDKTYRVATNEFLAPAGQDNYVPFKYMTNISYWGDMLDIVNAYVAANHGTTATAYNGPFGNGQMDGRIWRNGGNTMGSGTIIPVTILHHNDSHGNLLKGTYVGYTQLATLIKLEKQHNPTRTILVSGGDNIQGDAMMYFFKTAGLGYTADGTPIADPAMQINPLIKAFNAMGYAAMTLGNHEFNYGSLIFTSTLKLATFPILQANISDTGQYGLAEVGVLPYTTVSVPGYANGPIDIAILGIGNHRVPNYELPSNIPGLTFGDPIASAQNYAPGLKAANDVVVALTHIGFTSNPASLEVDNNVDTYLAAQVSGIDTIIGAHSHTNPASPETPYKYLPAVVGSPSNQPVLINQAYRYNNTLGIVVIGVEQDPYGGYKVLTRAGRTISVGSSIVEDPDIKAIIDPYNTLLQAYNNTVLGQTKAPITAVLGYTQETNGANLQADAAMYELNSHGIYPDFLLSGAMSNTKVADAATPASPVTLYIKDMFTLMPYENSLVVMNMNGPQLKTVLERAYRNYYYYKYYDVVTPPTPRWGGYSHYTTCMLDTNWMNNVAYHDTYPALPDGNNVDALWIKGKKVDFTDTTTYYKVATVNYLAAGSCNFKDGTTSLWPLDQIVNDTQYYVRDAVIHYIQAQTGPIEPKIEGRLSFRTFDLTLESTKQDPPADWNPVFGSLAQGFLQPLFSGAQWVYLNALNVPGNKLLDETVYNPFYVYYTPPGFFDYWAGRGVYEGCTGTWEPTMWEIINGRQPLFYLKINPDGMGGQTYFLVDGLTKLLGGGDTPLRLNDTYHLGNYTYVGNVKDQAGVTWPMVVGLTLEARLYLPTLYFEP